MLKKSDLSQQFELVVKQEIKNYNDSLSQIFKSINDLRDQIKAVENESLENFGIVFSQQKQLEIDVDILKRELANLHSLFKRQSNELDFFQQEMKKDLSLKFTSLIDTQRSQEYTKLVLESVSQKVSSLEDEMSDFSLTLTSSLENLGARLNKDIERTKKEIMSFPSDSQKVRSDLEEKLDSHVVDVEGLMKEIRINRKDLMIIEKKIENIYTLIERLKGGKE